MGWDSTGDITGNLKPRTALVSVMLVPPVAPMVLARLSNLAVTDPTVLPYGIGLMRPPSAFVPALFLWLPMSVLLPPEWLQPTKLLP